MQGFAPGSSFLFALFFLSFVLGKGERTKVSKSICCLTEVEHRFHVRVHGSAGSRYYEVVSFDTGYLLVRPIEGTRFWKKNPRSKRFLLSGGDLLRVRSDSSKNARDSSKETSVSEFFLGFFSLPDICRLIFDRFGILRLDLSQHLVDPPNSLFGKQTQRIPLNFFFRRRQGRSSKKHRIRKKRNRVFELFYSFPELEANRGEARTRPEVVCTLPNFDESSSVTNRARNAILKRFRARSESPRRRVISLFFFFTRNR